MSPCGSVFSRSSRKKQSKAGELICMTDMKQRTQKWHRRRIWILKILRIVAQLSLNNMLYMYSAYSSETLAALPACEPDDSTF